MGSTPPPQSSAHANEDRQAAQRREELQRISTTYIASRSWGESLVPIMITAMEACWLGAILIVIASTNFFGMQNLLLPLWAPFLLLSGTAWYAIYQQRAQLASFKGSDDVVIERSGSLWLYVLIACALLLTIWASIYSSTALLIDPRWLLSMLNDFSHLNTHVGWNVAIILIGTFCCWRGIRSVKRSIEPSNITHGIFFGLGVFIVAILLLTNAPGQSLYSIQLLMLIVFFFSLALLAHALAHTTYLRHTHPSSQQGGVGSPERGLFLMIGMICAGLLLVVLLIASFANPTFLTGIQHSLAPVGSVYDKGITLLVSGIAFLAMPIFWLFSLLPHSTMQPKTIATSTKPPKGTAAAQPPESLLIVSIVLQIALPILCIALLIYIIRRYQRKRRRLVLKNVEHEDVHESIWSWQLFWVQLREFFEAIWRRIFRRAASEQLAGTDIEDKDRIVDPGARSIREIYRAFLVWSTNQGVVRKKYETPDEFKQRVDEKFPLTEENLRALTEAYTAIRYGDTLPDESAVTQARQHWDTLRQQTL